MSLAIVSVSRQGTRTALGIANAAPDAVVFAPARFVTSPASIESAVCLQAYEGKAGTLIAQQFESRVPLVLVMAVGAAVRLIAPLLHNKLQDPAVVVVDDAGRYAISLVSGHAGGANDLTRQIAGYLDAEAIITTASDAAGLPSIDAIARERGWWIEPGSNLTHLAAALINGEPVGVYQDAGDRDWIDDVSADNLRRYDSLHDLYEADLAMALIISDRVIDLPSSVVERSVVCRPPVLVLGIGCSSGAGLEEVAGLVDATLSEAALSRLSAFALATIDRRRSDPCLVEFASERRLQFVTYGAGELEATAGDWTRSEVVRNAVGAGAVAEPAALRCAGASTLLVRKVKSLHVTLAVARIPSPGI